MVMGTMAATVTRANGGVTNDGANPAAAAGGGQQPPADELAMRNSADRQSHY
jgi:hypothetical protein